jgi:hypothetical protein
LTCCGAEAVAGFGCGLAGFWESACDPAGEAPTVSVDFCSAEAESVAFVRCSGRRVMGTPLVPDEFLLAFALGVAGDS